MSQLEGQAGLSLELYAVQADVALEGAQRQLVCGYPKTGRTWMRYMLATALSDHYELGIDVDLTNVYNIVPNDETGLMPGQPTFSYEGTVPKIEMSHRPYSADEHEDANTLFLTRDPRDVLVSHWLHHKNQLHRFDGDLTEFVHDPELGIDGFLGHLASWAPHLTQEQIMTYESMRLDPVGALQKATSRFGLTITEAEIQKAVAAGAMDRMREKEVEHGIAGHDYDRSNPEARRVRRGKVGGFVDYLQPGDEAIIHERIRASDSQVQEVIALTGYSQE